MNYKVANYAIGRYVQTVQKVSQLTKCCLTFETSKQDMLQSIYIGNTFRL